MLKASEVFNASINNSVECVTKLCTLYMHVNPLSIYMTCTSVLKVVYTSFKQVLRKASPKLPH